MRAFAEADVVSDFQKGALAVSQAHGIGGLEPNSVLFGIGSPAGIINSSTKFARIGRDFGSVTLRFGSYNERRASLDINESLGDKLAVRANIL